METAAVIVAIVGTGTDVGKTHVTCALLAEARASGRNAAAYKPVATGCDPGCEDAERHARAAGREVLAPTYAYRRPVSPHVAAREEGRAIDLATIAARARELARGIDILFVEGAGGLFSPLTDTEDHTSLVQSLAPDATLVVAPDRIGVIHDVAATLLAASARGLPRPHLVLSAPAVPDASTGENARELDRLGKGPVLAVFPRAAFDAPESLASAAKVLASL